MVSAVKIKIILFIFLSLLCSLLAASVLFYGPIEINMAQLLNSPLSSEYRIFWDYRVPKLLASALSGMALGVSGLIMQTYFRNPLAGPFILGIQSGASLFVGLGIFGASLFPALSFLQNNFSLGLLSFVGAFGVFALISIISSFSSSSLTLLIFGLLFSYLCNGIISIMISLSNSNLIKTFLMWGFGSFERLHGEELIVFTVVILVGISASFLLSKFLNLLSLGEDQVKMLGFSPGRMKLLSIFIVTILTSMVTAYCGPIAFVGLISPHVARNLIGSGDHKILLPYTLLIGASFSMLAQLISSFSQTGIPINAVLGLIGGPLIFFFLMSNRKREVF